MTPQTELGRKLLEIRERAIANGYALLSEEDIAELGSVDAWKLEAERLAELVEAQRQIIAVVRDENAILRKENERLAIQIAGNAYRPEESGSPKQLGE